MRDQPVDVGVGPLRLGEHAARHVFENANGQLEHRRTVHLQKRVAEHLAARHRAGHTQDVDMAAIGMQLARQNSRRRARFEHDSAGTVAEQHASRAVLEVEDA